MQDNNQNTSLFTRFINFFRPEEKNTSTFLNGRQHSMEGHILELESRIILLNSERSEIYRYGSQTQMSIDKMNGLDEKIEAFAEKITELKSPTKPTAQKTSSGKFTEALSKVTNLFSGR
jgi:sRNA-binding regulator protein Hfq